MSTVSANVKFTLRMLLRKPVSSLVLILTLALGIGVNAAIFSVVRVVLLRPLPYPEPHQLVAIWEAQKGGPENQSIPVADGNLRDIRARTDLLQGVAAVGSGNTLIGLSDHTVRAPIASVTRDFFPMFRVSPVLGRSFSPEEHGEGTPAVCLISHAFWMSAFGGASDVLGKTMLIHGEDTAIVGVVPPDFDFPRETVVWIDHEREIGESRTAHNLELVVGRLADGVTLKEAQAGMTLAAEQMAGANPDEIGSDFDLAVRSLHDDLVGNADSTLALLFATVGLVLLIACGNIAGIMLSRTVGRFKEFAIRQAAGASSGQLVAQLLVESATIGLLGAAIGLLLARWSLSLLNSVVPRELLHSGPITIDAWVVTFALLLGVVTGLLCGLAPIVRIVRLAPVGALHSGGAELSMRSGSRRGLGGLMVVPQYAFSLVALVVAGLLLKSLFVLLHQDPGYRTSGLVTSAIVLPTSGSSRYAERPVRASFYRSLAERIEALPGVHSVTFSHTPALAARQISGLMVEEGQPRPGPDDPAFYPYYRVVGANYFRTMGIQLLRGRDFTEADNESAEPVVIVNEAMADLMWPGENPIGKRVVALGLDFRKEESNRSLTVIAVAANVRHHGLDGKAPDAIYVPWPQHPDRARSLTLIAEVEPPTGPFTSQIRDLVRQADPSLPASPTVAFETKVRESVESSSFRAILLSVIACLALMLALLGVFGVMNYSVAQRIREMAIRLAIGARRWDLQRLILGAGLRYVVLGQILGTVAVVLLARVVERFLYQVSGTDLTVFGVVSLCLALAVLLTCYIPSWRASRVDPIGMLKEE